MHARAGPLLRISLYGLIRLSLLALCHLRVRVRAGPLLRISLHGLIRLSFVALSSERAGPLLHIYLHGLIRLSFVVPVLGSGPRVRCFHVVSFRRLPSSRELWFLRSGLLPCPHVIGSRSPFARGVRSRPREGIGFPAHGVT